MSNSRRALDERDGSNFCPANAIRVIYEHLVTDADSIIDYRDTDVLAQFKGVSRPANFTGIAVAVVHLPEPLQSRDVALEQ